MIKHVLLLLLILSLISCKTAETSVSPQQICATDSDCVPATCCHAIDAVNKEYAPKCSGIFCTQECAPGTLDCGQGKIGCVEGICTVVLLNSSE